MFTKFFWIRTAERAVKTFAQVLATVLTSDKVFNFFNANWNESLGAAAFAALLSVLTSVASTTVGEKDSPSLVESQTEEQVLERAAEGEPVGDPPKIVEPAYLDPIVEEEPAPVKKAARKPRKKVTD